MNDCFWTNSREKGKLPFHKTSLNLAILYLLDKSYFTLGSMFFRQLIGIPMGFDAALFIANLFLYFYEKKWLLQKRDLQKARIFSNIFMFKDDRK